MSKQKKSEITLENSPEVEQKQEDVENSEDIKFLPLLEAELLKSQGFECIEVLNKGGQKLYKMVKK